MNSTQSTAAASTGVSGAAIVVASWLLGKVGVVVPPDVSAAAMVLLSPALHFIAIRFAPKASS